ncbi:MAG: patatin-like phospholipase family protein [Bacteroidota bacterium]
MNEVLKHNLHKTKESKILSLDGGGLRGILTLGILKKLESEIRTSLGSEIRLCDYFDVIGGTSTGSIIASGLAIGKSVDEMIHLYRSLGAKIFRKGLIGTWTRDWKTLRAFFRENYSSKKLEKYLRSSEAFGDIPIGDESRIYCGLVINTKRADTYSLWSIANHPAGKYYAPNRELKLWELCKASSSAPYYFKPTPLDIKTRRGKNITTAFIDGGVSLANNPAWQLFLVATVPSFGFNREVGEKNISIISLGTGKGLRRKDPKKLMNKLAVSWAPSIPDLFMADALEMNQTIISSFGKNVGSEDYIDSQFGNMNDVDYIENKLFSFQRYNVEFNREFLASLGINLAEKEIESLQEMDRVENLDILLDIGIKYSGNIEFKL